jgi:hypothetical protein
MHSALESEMFFSGKGLWRGLWNPTIPLFWLPLLRLLALTEARRTLTRLARHEDTAMVSNVSFIHMLPLIHYLFTLGHHCDGKHSFLLHSLTHNLV